MCVDYAGLEGDEEQTWLAPDLFCPGILNLRGVETAAMLAAPHPLLLHHTGTGLPFGGIREAYKASRAEAQLEVDFQPASDESILAWVAAL